MPGSMPGTVYPSIYPHHARFCDGVAALPRRVVEHLPELSRCRRSGLRCDTAHTWPQRVPVRMRRADGMGSGDDVFLLRHRCVAGCVCNATAPQATCPACCSGSRAGQQSAVCRVRSAINNGCGGATAAMPAPACVPHHHRSLADTVFFILYLLCGQAQMLAR